MTILITGATGFIGRALTLRLLGAGHAVRVLVRDPDRALGRPAVVPTPAFALRAVLGAAADALLGGQHVRPRRLLEMGYAWRTPDLDAALADVLGAARAITIGRAPAPIEDAALAAQAPRYLLRHETTLDAPLEAVFSFFARAENLGLLTPPALAFRLLTRRPIEMSAGTVLEYTLRLGPAPVRWRTVIVRWEPGRGFVDVQSRGPYRTWWHEHAFRRDGARTVMEDRVYYTPPLGPLGWLANRLYVAPALRRIFAYRAAAVRLRYAARPVHAARPTRTRVSASGPTAR
jgi:ligand-binding SRPBCC domain-containing protein